MYETQSKVQNNINCEVKEELDNTVRKSQGHRKNSEALGARKKERPCLQTGNFQALELCFEKLLLFYIMNP